MKKYAIINNETILMLTDITENFENENYITGNAFIINSFGHKEFGIGKRDIEKTLTFDTFEDAKQKLKEIEREHEEELNNQVTDLNSLIVFCIKNASAIADCSMEYIFAIEKAKEFGIDNIYELLGIVED